MTNIWTMLAGIAIFLLGVQFLENGLKQGAGRPFKLFLKKQTASRPKAILGGAVVTGLLQSSSVVNLLVLAFVGANVIPMQQALAIILGANLGTTLDSWIIATIGFKVNIEHIAFPIVAIFGITMSVAPNNSRWQIWSRGLFGFGLLFVGLFYIKAGMQELVNTVDLSSFKQYPSIVFVFLGFVLTSLVQSGSVTIAIVLSALHVHIITLYDATAIVLGSEVGTTLKLVLASIKGIAAKKRVAWGNMLFNIITSILVFIFLRPVNYFITEVMSIHDPLIGLVFFQTLVNIIGIAVFYPFLGLLGKYLEHMFTAGEEETIFIHKVPVADKELAMTALENEVRRFLLHTIRYTREIFEREPDPIVEDALKESYHSKNSHEHYDLLKQLHGETHSYAILLQSQVAGDKTIALRLDQIIAANRNTMYAAKSMKDALTDINQLRNSSNDVKFAFYNKAGDRMDVFCKRIAHQLLDGSPDKMFINLCDIHTWVSEGYAEVLKELYQGDTHRKVSDIEISTLINVNREMYTAYKSVIFASKDFLLDSNQAAYFDELPGFIR